MVWIYGGGFMSGDAMGANLLGSYMYSGQEIADRGNVIYVSVAYRLGALGFLSTGDSTLPGKSNSSLITCTFTDVEGFTKYFFSERHKTLWRVHSCFINRKLWFVGPACCHCLGAQEHPVIWGRPGEHHHLWRICWWSKC